MKTQKPTPKPTTVFICLTKDAGWFILHRFCKETKTYSANGGRSPVDIMAVLLNFPGNYATRPHFIPKTKATFYKLCPQAKPEVIP